jgi:ABC-2 type transport system permease protein
MPIVLLVPLSRHESAIQYIPLGCYYAMVFVVAMASQVRHTDTPDAAWIYRSLPLPLPGQLLSGTVLAIVVGFVLPWCLLVSLVSLVFVGPASLLSSALATTASLALSLTFAAWTLRDVPFSTRFVQSNQASQFGIAMLSFAASGVAAALHFGLGLLPYGRVCALPLAAAALWLALRTVRGLERRKVILPPSH